MFFATTFGLIALLSAQAFFAQLQPPAEANAVDYLYFSLVTITTVGYGDLTPASDVGRITAVFEAVLGQLYLITVVALVVQNLGQQSRIGMRMQEELEEADRGGTQAGSREGAADDEEA
jgi:voltage-gated potassium channel Kch